MKNKDKVRLLKLTLKSMDDIDLFHTGICGLITNMKEADIIIHKEREELWCILDVDMPEHAAGLNEYWWICGLVEPRKKYLKMLIEKYKYNDKT